MMIRLTLILLFSFVAAIAQFTDPNESTKIKKAKAYLAAGNCSAASYELEKIRRDSQDLMVQSAANSILIECYVAQRDYKRVQKILEESFQNTKNQTEIQGYLVIAAQTVKNLRNKIERYRLLGISFSDRSLPEEVLKDIEKMREILETIIQQSSSLREDLLLPLIEESCLTRASLARDEYDSTYWKELSEDIKDEIRNSRKTISTVQETLLEETKEKETFALLGPQSRFLNSFQSSTKRDEIVKIGSLAEYATKKVNPVYPPLAKSLMISGTVRIEAIIDESGKVADIKSASGNPLLQAAAIEALKRWEFKPFVKDGHPVKAEGYVLFNFSLSED